MALELYRRHNPAKCKFTKREQRKCSCPIWAFGYLNGKRFEDQSLKTRMWGEAERLVASWEGDSKKEEADRREAVPVETAIKKYLTHCAVENNNAEATLKSYGKTLAHFAAHLKLQGIKHVAEITTQSVRDYLATRAQFTPKTRRKELEHIRFLLWFCVSQSWIEKNPASGYGEGKKGIRVKVPKGGSYQPLDDEEIRLLLDAADTITNNNPKWIARARLRARAMILVMCYTGLRISDVATLRRDEVKGDGMVKDHVLVKTKLLHWTRLGEETLRALLALPVESEYFFWSGPEESKLATCCGSMRRTLYSLGERTGVAVHPHRFRNTFSLKVMDETNDVRTLQQLLGHASLKSTEAYLHNSTKQDDHLKKTLANIRYNVIEMPKPKSA